jgi:hypothetical protein
LLYPRRTGSVPHSIGSWLLHLAIIAAIQSRSCTYRGLSAGRSMKIGERSQTRQVHSCKGNSGTRVQDSFRDSASTPGAAKVRWNIANRYAGAVRFPTHSGRYTLPLFHTPHRTAAKLRAALRRARRADSPRSTPRRYWSANGLFFWMIADRAAPRIVAFNSRLTRNGTRKRSNPLPLRRRSKPIPR